MQTGFVVRCAVAIVVGILVGRAEAKEVTFRHMGLTLNADLALDLSTVFVGLVLLVLAELFRIGSELQKETGLTPRPGSWNRCSATPK